MSEDQNKMGTPKSLEHAIYLSLCVGPLFEIKNRAYNIIKDFLAQRFGAYILKHPECETVLMELFEHITQKDFKEKPVTIEEWKKK